jgi:hypothetical protein
MQKPKIGEDNKAGISMYAGTGGNDLTEDELEDAVFRKKHSYHF